MRLKFYKQSAFSVAFTAKDEVSLMLHSSLLRHSYAKASQRRSTEKFVSRIDPEAFSTSGSRVIFPVACHLRFKASATKRDELEETPMKIPRCLLRGVSFLGFNFIFIICDWPTFRESFKRNFVRNWRRQIVNSKEKKTNTF